MTNQLVSLYSTGARPHLLTGIAMMESSDVRLLTTRCVRAINALGLPALVLPCGVSGNLPAGLQIAGPLFADSAVLRWGTAMEDALDFKRPTAAADS